MSDVKLTEVKGEMHVKVLIDESMNRKSMKDVKIDGVSSDG